MLRHDFERCISRDGGGIRLVQWLPDKFGDVEDDLETLFASGPHLARHGAHGVVQPGITLAASQVRNAANDFSPVDSAGPRVAVPGKQDGGAVISVQGAAKVGSNVPSARLRG